MEKFNAREREILQRIARVDIDHSDTLTISGEFVRGDVREDVIRDALTCFYETIGSNEYNPLEPTMKSLVRSRDSAMKVQAMTNLNRYGKYEFVDDVRVVCILSEYESGEEHFEGTISELEHCFDVRKDDNYVKEIERLEVERFMTFKDSWSPEGE